MSRLTKRLVTQGTFVRFLSSVDSAVLHKVIKPSGPGHLPSFIPFTAVITSSTLNDNANLSESDV